MSLTFDLLHTELNLNIPLRTEISQIYIVKLPELCLGTPPPPTPNKLKYLSEPPWEKILDLRLF